MCHRESNEEQSGGQQCESQTREAAAVATGNCGAVHGWFGVSDGQFRISGSGEAQLANNPPNPRLFVASSPVGIDQKRISGSSHFPPCRSPRSIQ